VSRTLTGGFPIGFRYAPLSAWSQDLQARIAWARQNGFSALDIGKDGPERAAEVIAAGLRLGSVDLLEWQGMLSPQAATRKEAVAKNAAYIEACAAAGPLNHFVVMLPEDPSAPPREVFEAMVASYTELAPVLEAHEAKIVIEGWPGPGALCCTPESYRAFFEACPSPALGVNYDPFHLIRMGIDPLRFLGELMARVYHVHAKDTELFDEARYEYGTEQKPLFGSSPGFGGPFWRYTLPGHGVMRWQKAFAMLRDAGYSGCVSVELEDYRFNGRQESEQAGLAASSRFLGSC
jgi:sugar phosphate isomerase/epimerase